MSEPESEILAPELGHKLIVALRSVTDPQAQMQAIADRAVATLRGEFNTRITAMDKATTLWHEDLVRVPTQVDRAIGGLKDLVKAELQGEINAIIGQVKENESVYEEKFIGVGTRFIELNTRLTEGDRYKQTALDAALLTNKESLRKTEELFSKQIDALQQTVDDLKGLVRNREGSTSGIHQGQTALIGWFIAAVMALIAVSEVVYHIPKG